MSLKQITDELVRVARETLPRDFRLRSGRVLYSPVETLVSGSPVYFLGANPGEAPGSKADHSLYTVESDIKRLETHAISKHAYLEESWKNKTAGDALIQVRAKIIFKILVGGDSAKGISLFRRTPTANLIFLRSPDLDQLERSLNQDRVDIAATCWPFHLKLIELVQPKLILTHSLTVAQKLAERLRFELIGTHPSGHGDWECCAWRLEGGEMFLGIPNLSRYKPSGTKEKAIREFFNKFVPGGLIE